jgi:hypothetical protein
LIPAHKTRNKLTLISSSELLKGKISKSPDLPGQSLSLISLSAWILIGQSFLESEMPKKFLMYVLLILCLLSQSHQASAWSYTIADDGWWNGVHYNLDKFEFFMVTPSSFADPPQDGFSVAGWEADLVNPHYSLATGPGAGYLSWTFNFAGAASTPVTLDWLAYSGGALVGQARVAFTGSSFSYTNNTVLNANDPIYDRAATVPVPPSVLLFGSALLGLGLLRGRSRKQ